MGLAWQKGPLGATQGRFLTAQPLPNRLLFAEPLRRRMRVQMANRWIADSEDVVLLHEPGRYPVAYFPCRSIRGAVLTLENHRTSHRDLGATIWYGVSIGGKEIARAAWQHVDLPGHASVLRDRIAFVWHKMDGFFEEDERLVGHAADPYHRIDIRQSLRHLVARTGDRLIADTRRPLVLFESGYSPRWYVPRDDMDDSLLSIVDQQTFCPYKGVASYYDIGQSKQAAWSYRNAWPEVARISDLVSFEPDKIDVFIDDNQLEIDAAQPVSPYGSDRRLDVEELGHRRVGVIAGWKAVALALKRRDGRQV